MPSPETQARPGRVLLIDDDEVILFGRRLLLEQSGLDVQTSQTVMCSPLITKFRPDVILMDVEMPGLQGDRATQAILKVPQFVQYGLIVLHSSLPLDDLRSRALASGAAGYLMKTVSIEEFVTEVTRWVERARRKAEGS